MRTFIYRFIQFLFRVFYRLVFRAKIVGRGNIPHKGAYILAPSHLSNLDPFLVGCFSGRDDLYYMAKHELFKNRIIGSILRYIKAFPVKRGVIDKFSIDYALDILKNGHCLLMFPEGTRRKNFNFPIPKKGIGFICANSNAKVIPVKVLNTNKWYKLSQMKLIIGKPVEIDISKEYFDISKEILDLIEEINEN